MSTAGIEAAHWRVMFNRVNGALAVSRALGDFDYKPKGLREPPVSCMPDVSVLQREPLDEFALIACDGIFDVFKNQELVDVAERLMRLHASLVTVANEILDTALQRVCYSLLACPILLLFAVQLQRALVRCERRDRATT